MRVKKKKYKISVISIFAIFFIIGGFISIISSIHYGTQVKNATYRKETIGLVKNIRRESDWTTYTDSDGLQNSGYIWKTKEEIQVENGINFEYDGIYYEEPNKFEINHTIISEDGITWEVNDSDNQDIFYNSLIGFFCIFIGNFIFYIEQKNYI